MSTTTMEVVNKLIALGIVTAYGTDVFISSMPNDPDIACCVYQYPGRAPEKQFGTKALSWEHPSIQVVFRDVAGEYDAPMAKAQSAYTLLGQIETEALGSTFYYFLTPNDVPFELKRENERVYIAVNFDLFKDISV